MLSISIQQLFGIFLKIGAILIFEATSIRVVQISAISVPLIPKKLIINCVVTKRSNNFDVSNLFD